MGLEPSTTLLLSLPSSAPTSPRLPDSKLRARPIFSSPQWQASPTGDSQCFLKLLCMIQKAV